MLYNRLYLNYFEVQWTFSNVQFSMSCFKVKNFEHTQNYRSVKMILYITILKY